ncbi:MAG: type II secretion protein F [Micavibrio sp.]|nr:type II secretion protein F [Micavibrio sp.]|tara:strand:- start:615584 stop:616537 length:954 start_codon:yes stop_codon:yes gene_type:complete
MFGEDTDQLIIIILSALFAAGSFMAFALPFLNNQEKKERYNDVIKKKRKALFEASKQSQKLQAKEATSARESVEAFFKFEKLFGKFGEKLRDQMLQAGIRDPKAPMYYLLGRIVLPIILMSFIWLIMAKAEKDFSGVQMLMAIAFGGLSGFFVPRLLVKNHIIKRQQDINLTFPDSLDMMLICVQGGIGLEQTINRIADEVSGHSETLAEELGILSAEMGMLNDRRRALQDFARRVGSGAARSFATAMIQAEQYGTSVSDAMRVIANDLRDQRMAEAERKAAALPPKLTVPMIIFFLPALFIIILAPAILQAKGAGL